MSLFSRYTTDSSSRLVHFHCLHPHSIHASQMVSFSKFPQLHYRALVFQLAILHFAIFLPLSRSSTEKATNPIALADCCCCGKRVVAGARGKRDQHPSQGGRAILFSVSNFASFQYAHTNGAAEPEPEPPPPPRLLSSGSAAVFTYTRETIFTLS